jgi:hypothetical protein
VGWDVVEEETLQWTVKSWSSIVLHHNVCDSGS